MRCRAVDVCRNTVLNVQLRFAEGRVDGVRRATIEWQFTSRQARVKLKERYPARRD